MSDVSSFKVGGIEVIALNDGYNQAPNALFPDHEADKAVAAAAQAGIPYDGESVTIPVSAFVIRAGASVVLVDSGNPPARSETSGHFARAFEQAGIGADEITHIALTHLHIDHVGGLIDSEGKARFANAELICAAPDWVHFHSDEVFARANERGQGSIMVTRQSVAPYAEGRREVTGEAAILPGLTMIPLPGHTPGHSGLMIEDAGEQLLIWGDTIHCETFQLAEPDWGVMFDVDIEQARATRKAVFDRVATDRIRIAGQHVNFPGFAFLERAGQGYRMIRDR
ncbi:MBL fold metallo-hydrolase [Albibacillus kandeliae]|uniref:MBL fold metallo-hydrolase n=1 Tax=Albibacillus kandeliae TaxID=2174228 RepID=UPI000D687183|nr:MBL fold metallo-hydrolase [Albibacillus kandeliae]